MNSGNTMRLWLVLGIAVAFAAALGWMRFATPAAPPGNLAGASIGGPFTLVDQNGKTVRESDFAGRYRLIYFGYGFCPDICPNDLAVIGRGLAAFERPTRRWAGRSPRSSSPSIPSATRQTC
ncbi:MAG: hypothetical protein RIS17_1606 [Pseudomonadota bacterium]